MQGESYKETVHTHHSTRKVQLQGGKMQGHSTSAVWFLECVLMDKFSALAKSKRLSIAQFNQSLNNIQPPKRVSIQDCGFCQKSLDHRSMSLLCNYCALSFHTGCLKKHRCNPHLQRSRTSIPDTITSSSLNLAVMPPPVSASPHANSLTPGDNTTTQYSGSVSFLQPSTIPELTPSISAPIPSTSLNPRAPLFSPTDQATGSDQRKKKSHSPNNSSFNPGLESIKIELSYAKARIADLENQVNDKEQSIKIYLQKISLLEANRYKTLPQDTFPTPDSLSSYANPESLCPCQTRLHISSIISRLTSFEQRVAAVESQVQGRNLSSHQRDENELFNMQNNDTQPDERVATNPTTFPRADI